MKDGTSLRVQKAIPWEEIRATFVADGKLTLRAVAKRFEAPLPRVYERSCAERWVEARQEFQRKTGERLVEAARQKLVATGASQIASFLADLARIRSRSVERYLEKIDAPESEDVEITKAGSKEGEGDTVIRRRKVPLNHARFVERIIATEADFLKSLFGVAPRPAASIVEESVNASDGQSRTRRVIEIA